MTRTIQLGMAGLVVGGMILLAGCAATASHHERGFTYDTIGMNKVPPAVVLAVRERYPTAQLHGVERISKAGRIVRYRFAVNDQAVEVTRDGKVIDPEARG